MASGPYRSNSFNFMVQQFRRLRDEAQRRLRQGTIAAIWTAQVLLYPIYVLFQTTRLVGQQLHQAVKQAVPQLRSHHSNPPASPESADRPLAVDTPIHQILRSLADLDLPLALSPSAEKEVILAMTGAEPQPLLQSADSGAIVPTPSATLSHGSASDVGTQLESHPALAELPDVAVSMAPVVVRGIASLLGTQHLVLVSDTNALLDILTLEQQQRLHQRMSWEMAGYYRSLRLFETQQVSRSIQSSRMLPLPNIRPTQWRLVRGFHQLMAWMQTSDVAIAANLFQETRVLAQLPTSTSTALLTGNPFSLGPMFPDDSASLHHQIPISVALVAPKPASPSSVAPASPWAIHWQAVGNTVNRHWETLIDWLQPPALLPSGLDTPLHRLVSQSPKRTPTAIASTFTAFVPLTWQLPMPLGNPDTPASAAPPHPNHAIVMGAPPASSAPTAPPPDWIEIDAIVLGYVKHPLEQLLEWLDQGMLWVELHWVQLWQWLMHRQSND